MPSPSSPLEYRPTPHLILIILFVVFPLIYLCGRLFVASCFMLTFILKCMFLPILRLLYGDELIPMHTQNVPSSQTLANTVRDGQVEQSSDEQLTDECDGENELMSAVEITNECIEAQPKSSTKLIRMHESLHDSEHDSGNDDDHSALSTSSTATNCTSQSVY